MSYTPTKFEMEMEHAIDDGALIKEVMDAVRGNYATMADALRPGVDGRALIKNWNDPGKISDDTIAKLKTALGTPLEKGIRPITTYQPDSKYIMYFQSLKEGHHQGCVGMCEIIVYYNPETGEASYTESWVLE